jgi:hypothetical protein
MSIKIKSRAPLGYIRAANHSKYAAFDKLANVPGDTLDNSLDRLRLLVVEANQLIADMEADRSTIEAYRADAGNNG